MCVIINLFFIISFNIPFVDLFVWTDISHALRPNPSKFNAPPQVWEEKIKLFLNLRDIILILLPNCGWILANIVKKRNKYRIKQTSLRNVWSDFLWLLNFESKTNNNNFGRIFKRFAHNINLILFLTFLKRLKFVHIIVKIWIKIENYKK